MTKDMTTGSPMKLVLSFAIPLMFGNLFQQFYSMVDTIIVGRWAQGPWRRWAPPALSTS